MLATPHMLTGAAIGILIGNFPAAIVLAFISHFILDRIPHTEVSAFQPFKERENPTPRALKLAYRIAYVDIIIGIALLAYFYHKNGALVMIVGAFFALLPDILHEFPWWKKFMRYKAPIAKQLFTVHKWAHITMKRKYLVIGVITQLIIVGAAIWILSIR